MSESSNPPIAPPEASSAAAGSFLDPIPNIIPFRTLTIFAGAPAVGKTTMLVEWIQRWLAGRTICGHSTNLPQHFYYVCADRGLQSDKFYHMLGDEFRDRCTFYSVVSRDSGLDPDSFHNQNHGKDLIKHVFAELNPQPGAHLIIDPLAPLFITGSQNNTRNVAASLIGLSRYIQDYQVNITGTWHFAKQKTDKADRYMRPQDRISGSGAVSGFSDTQIYLVDPEPAAKPPIDYHLLGWNPRYAKPEEFRFTREEWFVPYVGMDQVGAGSYDPTDENKDSKPTQVAKLLPTSGLRYTEWEELACARLTISRKTFEMHVTTLRKRNEIWKDEATGKWYYRDISLVQFQHEPDPDPTDD